MLKKNNQKKHVYEQTVKRGMDRILSFIGLMMLIPLYSVISIIIYIDDPGPVFFTQKRVGKNRRLFRLHKFRTMNVDAPHDRPTHLLDDPDQYITRVGRFLRKYSLDELPQIWDIFIGNMSIIGPRPALWNQKDLVRERERYDANNVLPGLTGWAQINGRDELTIEEKARLDGEYVRILKLGGWKAFAMDVKCFLGTIYSVAKSDGVMEGRAKTMQKEDTYIEEDYGFRKKFVIDTSPFNQKRVLITGAGSYIGESYRHWAEENYRGNFQIDEVDMRDGSWEKIDFSSYDIVFHVAGIAHSDLGKGSEETKRKYYQVNTSLAINTARKARREGVKQFIFMSSMIIYGEAGSYGKKRLIDKNTVPNPDNFYGDSKWQADKGIRKLSDNGFQVAVLRPPMIYGKGSRGNYPVLARAARKMAFFPDIDNERSMLHIDNFCEFLCLLMLSGQGGIYFPQNTEYIKTSDMVKSVAGLAGNRIHLTKVFNPALKIASYLPGKMGRLVNKAFGNNTYDHKLSTYEGLNYNVRTFSQSIQASEQDLVIPEHHGITAYSVLMSVYQYDRADYVIEAIESMLNQTCPCEQFVIVEDGFIPLELEEVINHYGKKMPDIFTIVKLKKNGGLGNALNQGIKQCRNELIARMDADDISLPGRCEKQLRAFRNNPKISILGGQINEFVDRKDNIVSSRIVPLDYEQIKRFARKRSPFNHVTVMYRKSVIESLGGYVTYQRKEDLELFVRAVHEGVYAENIADPLVLVRVGEDNLKRRKSWKNCKEYIDIMWEFHKKGYNHFIDMAYVAVGQTVMWLAPVSCVKNLSRKMLRSRGMVIEDGKD